MFSDAFPHMRRGIACGAVAIVLAATSPAAASIIHVDDDAPPGGDGTSWLTAFNDLQDALAIAQEGDEIRVAQGIYKPAPPNGPRTATFNLVNGTTLRGGYAGLGASDPDANNPQKFETILSGDLNGDDGPNFVNNGENVYHVITAVGVKRATALRGVSIVAGNASVEPPFPTTCFGEVPDSMGAGLLLSESNLHIEECIIRDNRANCAGGGVGIVGGAPVFIQCRIQNNHASGSGGDAYAGGVFSTGYPAFIECEFLNNRSAWYSGAMMVAGQGAALWYCTFRQNYAGENVGALGGSNLMIVDCHFDQNIGGHGTGGINCSNSMIVNSSFTRNSGGGASLYNGVALRAWDGTVATNCTFLGNTSGVAPIAIEFGSSVLTNITVVGNDMCCAGGLLIHATGELSLHNSIIWDNSNEFGGSTPISKAGALVVTNSCIQGWTGSLGGTGNHGNDPRFIDADGPDDIYGTEDDNPRLLANSPLIDHGDTSALPSDTFDLDEDGDTSEPIPFDLDWLQRIVGPAVDVGAYEFQGTPCLADITGDNEVNVHDLLAVLDAWGSCVSGQPCNADLTLDAAVSLNDFLVIINNWGACP